VSDGGGGGERRRLLLSDASFALGSACFACAALPSVAVALGAIVTNAVFVVGSVFFTLGAGLALGVPNRSSSVIQFVGTLFFNASTTIALAAAVPAGAAGGTGWRPDAYGSICFLVSSLIAVAAVARQRGSRRDGVGAVLNLLGSVLFGFAAVGAFELPGTDTLLSPFWTGVGTVGGAVCFLVAAVLGLLPAPAQPRRVAPRTN
jgi:drug/metabolite transporter superfamily protein YnfA